MPVSLRRHWRLAIDVALYVTLVTLYALSGTVLSVPWPSRSWRRWCGGAAHPARCSP